MGYRADFFPLFLEVDEFVGRLFPVGAVPKGFGGFAQLLLGFQVFGLFYFQRFEEQTFLVEKRVADLPEFGVNLVVDRLGCRPCLAPFFLNGHHFIARFLKFACLR